MSKIIKNEEGEDEEVFTADEIQAQRDEAITKYKEENPDNKDELQKAKDELKKATEALEKAGDKDKNLIAMRKAKEDAEAKLAAIGNVDEKIARAKSEVLEGVNKDHFTDTLKILAGEDAELAKKIEFHYKRLGDTAGTKAEITAKLQDAYTLATGQSNSAMNSSSYSSANAGRPKTQAGSAKLSQPEKDLAKKMAAAGGMKLEDKDFG